MTAALEARDVVAAKDKAPHEPVSFTVPQGFTLLCNERESHTTALALTLAGRRKPVAGTVYLYGEECSSRELYKKVALAGATEIDTLERLVPVRSVIREQLAWALPFWKVVPRDVLAHTLVEPWLEPLGLSDLDVRTKVGELSPFDRYLLRILLGLVARKNAQALIVDDIDQLRSIELRAHLCERLDAVSRHVPVLAMTVNVLESDPIDSLIDLRSGK